VSARNVPAGSKKEIKIRQGKGSFSYNAKFTVKWGSGKSDTFSMRFTMTSVTKLKLSIKPEDVDLDTRVMTFQINNPAKRAELIFVGKNRKPIYTKRANFNNAKAGSDLTIKWRDPGQDVLYMDLKVYDIAEFWTGMRLTPFSISIPHDDVEFDSGKWNIKSSEESKLKATMGHIKKALDEHGTLLTLKLYVAGYTDTVGSTGANNTLSNNRARSISRWFRKKGLKIPIYYQGFGERVLAVNTPDNTDEQRNRRALYILSSQQPSKGGQTPDDKWKRVR